MFRLLLLLIYGFNGAVGLKTVIIWINLFLLIAIMLYAVFMTLKQQKKKSGLVFLMSGAFIFTHLLYTCCKIFHWPSSELLIGSYAVFGLCVILLGALTNNNKPYPLPWLLACTVSIIGIVCKRMHWPLASELIDVGFGGLLTFYTLRFLAKPKNKKISISKWIVVTSISILSPLTYLHRLSSSFSYFYYQFLGDALLVVAFVLFVLDTPLNKPVFHTTTKPTE